MRLLESKHKSGKYAEELAQLFILTNEPNVVDLGGIDNRRFIIMEMDNTMRTNKEYYDKLFAMVASPKYYINWFKYMMSKDLTHYKRYGVLWNCLLCRAVLSQCVAVTVAATVYGFVITPGTTPSYHRPLSCLASTLRAVLRAPATCLNGSWGAFARTPSFTVWMRDAKGIPLPIKG